MRNLYLGNYKNEGVKSLHVLTKDAKNKIFGPTGPPHVYKCLNV